MRVHVRLPTCPYCHEELVAAQAKSGCPQCMAWQHVACSQEQGGCAACGAPLAVSTAADAAPTGQLAYRIFASSWSSWSELFSQAASFASSLGPERVVDISHSSDQNEGTVAVWYRADAPSGARRGAQTLAYQVFRSGWASWGELFAQAVAAGRGEQVLGFSHCEDKNEGVVAVWYWR